MYPDDLKYTDRARVGPQPRRARGLGAHRHHPLRPGRPRRHRLRLAARGGGVGHGRQHLGELESTKSVSDVYAPVTGEVVARNDALDATPELVNTDPYGGGWLFEVVPSDGSDIDGLMDAATYESSLFPRT